MGFYAKRRLLNFRQQPVISLLDYATELQALSHVVEQIDGPQSMDIHGPSAHAIKKMYASKTKKVLESGANEQAKQTYYKEQKVWSKN